MIWGLADMPLASELAGGEGEVGERLEEIESYSKVVLDGVGDDRTELAAAMAGFTAAARAFCGSGEVGVEKGGLGSCVGVNGSSLGARCGWRSGELGSPREPWLGRAGMGARRR